jgi:hypothetical protein
MEDRRHEDALDAAQDALKGYRDTVRKYQRESRKQIVFPLVVLVGLLVVLFMAARCASELGWGEGGATLLAILGEGAWFWFLFRVAERIRQTREDES